MTGLQIHDALIIGGVGVYTLGVLSIGYVREQPKQARQQAQAARTASRDAELTSYLTDELRPGR